jgi:6-phosphogluconolactonase/glucosamine-6-phosphate isomerase/deaminase
LLRAKPNAVLGLATGSTPLRLYRELVRQKLDWRRVTTFNLKEYVGLAPDHPQSYHSFMWENFFQHINNCQTERAHPRWAREGHPCLLYALRETDSLS